MNSSDEESLGAPSILADNGSEDDYLPSDSDDSSARGANDGDNEADAVADYRHNETDDSEAEATVEGRPKRCRKRQTKEWKCNERKRKRNSGTSYVSRKGKIVAEKQFSNLDCRCKKGCFNKITEQARKVTFESFWKIGTHSAQNALICGLIKQETPQRHRPTTNTRHQKSTTNAFYLSIDGKSELVCKKYFLETLKISDGRMTRALNKVKIGEPPGDDKRGKKAPGNKTPEEKMTLVRDHISSFPSYESHYTRRHNPNRKYLSEDLNIRLMYNLYKEHVESQGRQPVEEHIYRRTFNNEFNLHFHAPHKDTCVKCDVFANKLKHTADEDEKMRLKQDHELHLRKAEKARDSMTVDSEKSANDENYYAFSFDLEKSLPFPKLVCQQAYYKRNMYIYNLGCHELSSKMGFMYCWDEINGSKGSQEISACLLKHIETRAPAAKHVVMYSDTCTGQNRNWKVAMALMKHVLSPDNMTEIIDQKFMQSGHSYLPNDCDFASIENFSRSQQIFTPYDWYRTIAKSRKKKAFHVTTMSVEEFLSVDNILKKITKRKKDCDGHPVSWLKMQWIRYQKSEPFKIFFKDTVSEEMPFSTLNFMPSAQKGRPLLVCNINQSQLYSGLRTVTKEKKRDMMDLLPYIPPVHHNYFQNLLTSEDAVDIGPLIDSADEESENE